MHIRRWIYIAHSETENSYSLKCFPKLHQKLLMQDATHHYKNGESFFLEPDSD